MSGFVFDEITTSTPEKSLLAPIKKKGGRNNMGRITVRHRGGGHKRRYRIIDFLRNKINISAKVVSIEYDPNRTCRIALLHYHDGEKRYIIAPAGLKIGQKVSINLIDATSLTGSISYVSKSANPSTRTYKIEATVNNKDGRIREGLSADMLVPLREVLAHLIPSYLISLNDEGELGVKILIDKEVKFSKIQIVEDTMEGLWAVSYTHLTLPTKRIV